MHRQSFVSRRAVAITAGLTLVASLAVVITDSTRSTVNAAPESTITTDYRKDPYLAKEQVKLLDELSANSAIQLRAESWQQARTVGRLELEIPSGLDPKASLTEHAIAFVQQHLALWNLADIRDAEVTRVVSAGDCSTVTFSRITPDRLVVANAAMSVVLTRDGVIRGVAGQLTGRSSARSTPRSSRPPRPSRSCAPTRPREATRTRTWWHCPRRRRSSSTRSS
ncbi:hypothetical protein ACFQY4_15265 [Catellatospora bangladeshensis]|uniref:hypothetical protein n=1 Tax=Catellatospora bangladeshensis TaxID=310355 RepID=UPI00360CF673